MTSRRLARLSGIVVLVAICCQTDTPFALGQQPYLVKDINATQTGTSFTVGVAVGSTLYFNGNDGSHGSELWRSDGTTAGTVLVKDIYPGSSGSSIGAMANVNGTLFFTANDGINGLELWKSDGSDAGTMLVKDILPGPDSSSAQQLVNVNGTLYFRATDTTFGAELWKSDGTAAGTVLVKDIHPSSSSNPSNLTDVNGTLFFTATDNVNGTELWKSDGTLGGTTLVKDLVAGSSNPTNLTNVGGTLFFTATVSGIGQELWKSDGTSAGTTLVSDIVAGAGSSSPNSLTNVNGVLYFAATDSASGPELWKSDGTAAGTVLVRDILSGNSGSNPSNLINVNGTLFFRAADVNGTELWKSDGTAAGTLLVKDINTSGNSNPNNLTNVGGTLFFSAINASGEELWKSDGTSGGTMLVKDIRSGANSSSPSNLANAGGRLFLAANDGINGAELWTSDGTGAGTVLVKNLFPGSGAASPGSLAALNGMLLFAADDGVTGSELWKSDGTTDGTVLVKDIFAGSGGSSMGSLVASNGVVFFAAQNSTNGLELWRTDGTAAGTVMVKDIVGGAFSSSPSSLTDVNGTLFFTAFDGTNGVELWKSDGTAAGTVLVKDIYPGFTTSGIANPVNVNGTLFFTATDGVSGVELWKSDGTSAGTVMIKDIASGSASSSPASLVNVSGVLYFRAADSSSGTELWKSDGTAAGTQMVKDIAPGAVGSGPDLLVAMNGAVYFRANDGSSGIELWKSDGTAAGTVLVKDILPGSGSSSPLNLTNINGTLYFAANDGVAFTELFKSDGTAAGTVLVKDIAPGPAASNPGNFTGVNGTAFFTATDGSAGIELWKSDGTDAGTTMVGDIAGGTASSQPASLTPIGNLLFFVANDGVTMAELWAFDATNISQTITVTTPAPPTAAFTSTFTVVATTTSALGVEITAGPGGVCSVASGGIGNATIQMNSGTGTCTVRYNQFGDGAYAPATEVTSSTVAAKIDAAVMFTGAPASAPYDSAFTVSSATNASTSPVYSSFGSCSNNAETFTMTASSGSCMSIVTWPADADYNAASLSQTTNAVPVTQTITFDTPADVTYGAAPITVSATGGLSGNPVTFVSTTTAACTASGPNGSTITIVGAGGCSITASQAAGGHYAAATDVTRSFNILKAPSATTVTGGSFTFDGNPHQGSAVVSGTGIGITQTVAWSYSGSCTSAPTTVPEGTSCVARADYAGDNNHLPSFGTAGLTVSKAASVTAISCPASVVYSGAALMPCSGLVTGAGGLSVTASLSYNGNVDAGTDIASASFSYPGDANHTGSSDSAAFSILRAPSTTAVTGGSFVYDGVAHQASAIVNGAGSGVTQAVSWTYSGSCSTAPTTVADGASCSARADYAGDVNHEPSFGTALVAITAASSQTAVSCPASTAYTGAPLTPCTVAVTGVGGLSLTPTPVYTNNLAAGTASASYSFAGDANHAASGDSTTFTIAKALSQTVVTGGTFVYDGATHQASALVSGAGGGVTQTVTWTYSGSCTTAPSTVAAGTSCTARADYAGDANHAPSFGTALLTITAASSQTAVSCPASAVYTGAPLTPCTVAVTGSGGLSLTPPPVYANNVAAGSASASYSFAGDANHAGSSDSRTFTIGKAPSQTIVTGGTFVYDGAAHPASAVVSGTGNGITQAISWTFSGSCSSAPMTVPQGTGCTARADYAGDANHSASFGSASVSISRRPLTITAAANTKVFDGNTSAAAVPAITSGTLATGDSAVLSETYDTPTAGTGKTLTPAALISHGGTLDVTGSYAITLIASTAGVIDAPATGSSYDVSGFLPPKGPGSEEFNSAKAGQSVPVKWFLTLGGVPVTDPSSFAGLYSYAINCETGVALAPPIQEAASGNSSLKNKGDGNWQYNWNTAASFKGSCRVVYVKLKDGTSGPGAYFSFK